MASNTTILAARRQMQKENVLMPATVRQSVERLATLRYTSKAEIIREALREYLAKQPELKEAV